MKERILIVEDEPGISLPVKDELLHEGFEVRVVEDGLTALQSVLEEPPDLIVLDLMLPGMNGLDVCRQIRHKGLDVPIIMLTAKAQEVDRVVGLEIGADDYMTKPFSLRELLARIRVRLRRQGSTAVNCNGSTITHYRILERLGAGGMGVVYKAEDVRLRRPVALKFLSPHLALEEKEKTRFLQEAQALAALDDPHIGAVFDIDQTPEGQVFIAMAYYDGGSLKDRLQSGALSCKQALEIAIQVARGLSRAHARGIIHRDIKPANIMLTKEGTAKIVDFGLARSSRGDEMTTSRMAMGTPAYVSPEQARGERVDQRTDIWSLGLVLYEMLTGQLPSRFSASEPAIVSGLPAGLHNVLNKALAVDPGNRYQHIAEMLADLQSIVGVAALRAAPADQRPATTT